jgi:hypothetical protein
MADNYGVLGSSSSTVVGTATAYTCPANKAAKVKIFAMFQAGSNSDVGILVNTIEVARTGAMTAANYCYTNGGAGLLTAPGATKPTGQSAAATAQPGAPIYYLSAGQTVQYTIATANLTLASVQVVGVEVDLTL